MKDLHWEQILRQLGRSAISEISKASKKQTAWMSTEVRQEPRPLGVGHLPGTPMGFIQDYDDRRTGQ